MTEHLRLLEPAPGLLAFYDGRQPGQRFLPQDNWVDDGAISLGIASYALVEGEEALVYDTHVSLAHAQAIRAALWQRGVRRFTTVLSHWHLDHVAGTEVFADGPVIANARTLAHLTTHRAAIEDASHHGLPAIAPLILPDRIFDDRMSLTLGRRRVELITANIHSDDATLLWLPEEGLLLAGDTVEDSVTYVGAPEDFDLHLQDLARLEALRPRRILPNHGAPQVIAEGGYGPGILGATARYIRWLRDLPRDPSRATLPLQEVIGPDLAQGNLTYFAPYERVHAQNIRRSLAAR